MSRKKEHLEKRLENERQLEPVLKKYSPEGSKLDKRKDVDLCNVDMEEGVVYVRINPSASREMIHFLLDKELDERWPPLHKKKKELTPEQRNIFERGMKDFFQKIENMGWRGSPQELKAIESDFWNAWTGRRLRAERLRDLEIYRLRVIGKVIKFPVYKGREKKAREYRQTVKKKSFVEIGREFGVTGDAARKAFNRAYELIYGVPYTKDAERNVQKTLLKKDCGTCSDRPSCEKLCAEVEAYSYQGWGEEPKRHGLYNDDITPDPRWEEDV